MPKYLWYMRYTFVLLQAFAVIGTMNFLRVIVALIPFALRSYGEAKVSYSRMEVNEMYLFVPCLASNG